MSENLSLNLESAVVLRNFAASIDKVAENNVESIDNLFNAFNSIYEKLGPHKNSFKNLLTNLKTSQNKANYAIAMLSPKMIITAIKIEDYVRFKASNTDYNYSRKGKSLDSYYLENTTYTKEDVATYLNLQNITVAYQKDANNTSKLFHEINDPIVHPTTKENLKPVKGYYATDSNNHLECVYAEFVNAKGQSFSYTKRNGNSILSQITKDQKDSNAFNTQQSDVSFFEKIRHHLLEKTRAFNNKEIFNDSPDHIKYQHEKHNSELYVHDKPTKCSHYSPSSKTIVMDSRYDDDEYLDVYKHEYGHFIDHVNGWISQSDEFVKAYQQDCWHLNEKTWLGARNTDDMLIDLKKSNAKYDRSVSDILSATYNNNETIVKFYMEERLIYSRDKNIKFYGHENKYWKQEFNRENEVFAQIFAIYSKNHTDSISFIQKYFPNTVNVFNNKLKELQNERN